MEDVNFSCAAGGKDHAGVGVKDVRVHPVADRKRLKDFAAVDIDRHEKCRTSATGK